MAPPNKLTPELQAKIIEQFEAGNWTTTVCDFVGITRMTFHNWMKRGERGKPQDIDPINFVDFYEAVSKAIAQVEITTVHELRQGPMNWQAKAWWLERRHPDRWGNRGKNTNTNINVDLSELSDEDLDRLIQGEEIDLSGIARTRRERKTKTA